MGPSQEERCRYEALALISEQDDPEMALDLSPGAATNGWESMRQLLDD